MIRTARIAAAWIVGSVSVASPIAYAQDSEPRVLQEVVVTGSRIARPDFQANTPITSVGEEILENSGSFALESKLLQLPQFAGAGNSQYSTGYFNSGAATLNMRNLGDNRNLVLLDGRRLQPSTAALAIDINTIPAAMIESVEVITGGASAVYGADAVSGVANFKLQRDFAGAQLDAYYGLSERGDNRLIDLSAVIGGNFAQKRGNAALSIGYSDREPVRNVDVPFLAEGFRVGALAASSSFLANGYYKPAANAPSQAAVNAYFGAYGAAPGTVPSSATLGFNNDGTSLFNVTGASIYNYTNPLYPRFVIDTYSTPGRSVVKQNLTADTLTSLPMTRWSVFGKGDFEFDDSVAAFAQVLYTRYDSTTVGGPPVADNFWQVAIPRDGAHAVPSGFAALLDSRANRNDPWVLGKLLSFMGMGTVEHSNDVFQVLAGLRGRIADTGLAWEAYGSTGRTQLVDEGVSGFASFARYQELMLAPNYGANYTGAYGRCTSGISPFGEINGAGAGQFGSPALPMVSADCIDYLNPYQSNTTRLEQDVIEATLQGKAFELPAGAARFALGAGYRSNGFAFRPDRSFAPDASFASDIIGQFGILPVTGSNNVKEIYGEVLLPLLRDLPLLQSVELNVAYRYSDYNHAGTAETYKADLSWQMAGALRLRGGYQRAVRAPNVIEQFGPPTLVFDAATDPCLSTQPTAYGNIAANPARAQVQALCRTLMGAGAPPITNPATDPRGLNSYSGSGSASLNSYPSGNPNVKAEQADTYTLGAVFSPDWNLPLQGEFDISVDYYNIKIDGAIGYVNAQLTYQLCFNANGSSNPAYDVNNVYCQAIRRSTTPNTGYPTGVFSTYLNQGGIQTAGIDVQGDLRFHVGPGQLQLNMVVNRLDSFERRVAPGAPDIEYAGFAGGYFEWKTYTNVAYAWGDAMAGLRWRHLSGVKPQDYLVAPCSPTATRCFADTDAYDIFDLYGTYRITERLQARTGIDNAFDQDPPVTRGIAGSTDVQNYDILGRRYYLAVSAQF
jgi:iron complex outermembrane recepter protein